LECIHGLEDGLCDSCFPKAQPVKPVPVRARVTRGSTTMLAPKRVAGASAPTLDVSKQRIYHVTHVDNLAEIVELGELIADATPAVDISSTAAREGRRTITVGNGNAVSDYVPFFLSPTSEVWNAVRFGTPDPRLDVAREAAASDFVMLVSSVDVVGEYVVADGDAAHPLTRFATDADAAEIALKTLRLDEENGRILSAEVLVKEQVTFDRIALVAVANDRARTAVKAILDAADFRTRVSIHPPWFSRDVE
jgi:hypothetical protein